MNIYLEIFGYIGTALVLLSMMMTSLVKLRWLNSAGSLISMIYAYCNNTWPVVLLNLGLLVINIVQLVRLYQVKVIFDHINLSPEDRSLHYFLSHYEKDIKMFFPEFIPEVTPDSIVYMVYRNADPVGVLIGSRQGKELTVTLDYATPQYRDCSVAGYLFRKLKEEGVVRLLTASETPGHYGYLQKMGFVRQDGLWVKNL